MSIRPMPHWIRIRLVITTEVRFGIPDISRMNELFEPDQALSFHHHFLIESLTFLSN